MTKAIELKNVSLKYNETLILDNVSFYVPQGEIFGLIGHNGAGKTSLLKILLGMIVSYTGSLMFFNDTDVEKQRAKIGSVMDVFNTEQQISALKYITRLACMMGETDKDLAVNLLKKVGLGDIVNKSIGQFSLGMKRRLDIACGMINSPKILILDEPFNGIDPKGMNEIRVLLQQLSSEGITVFLTSHNIHELIKFASVFGVIRNGKVSDIILDADLNVYEQYKYVAEIEDPSVFLGKTDFLANDICYNFNSPKEINIFGETENEILDKIVEIKEFVKGKAEKVRMSKEEILLWKMGIHK